MPAEARNPALMDAAAPGLVNRTQPQRQGAHARRQEEGDCRRKRRKDHVLQHDRCLLPARTLPHRRQSVAANDSARRSFG